MFVLEIQKYKKGHVQRCRCRGGGDDGYGIK